MPSPSPSSEVDSYSSENDTNTIFKCFKCTRAYSTALHRYKHFHQVHEKKKYMLTCSQCRRKFSQCDDLLLHINECHKMIYTDDSFD